MNVQDVFNRVRRTFGDEGSVQITDEDLFRWVNDAQLQISTDNHTLMEAIGTTSIVDGTDEYTTPDDMNSLRSLSYKGYRLKVLSFAEFNEYIDGYDASPSNYGKGTPEVFMVYAGKITLFPTPNETVANGLKVFYSKYPAQVATLADSLTVPQRYHNSVVNYCLQQAYELDEDLEKSSYKKSQFDESVMKAQNQDSWTSTEYYPSITVLPDDENYGSLGL